MLRPITLISCVIAAAIAAPGKAQETELEEVVISGQRQPGAVVGDIPPDVQLSAQEIRALGVSNVSELLQALAPVLGTSQGRGGERPVVLLNGARISGFNEIRDLPSEAILRTDILPEEVALKYGYRATQRVVNIVLRPRFRSITAEAGAQSSSAGGREGADLGLQVRHVTAARPGVPDDGGHAQHAQRRRCGALALEMDLFLEVD